MFAQQCTRTLHDGPDMLGGSDFSVRPKTWRQRRTPLTIAFNPVGGRFRAVRILIVDHGPWFSNLPTIVVAVRCCNCLTHLIPPLDKGQPQGQLVSQSFRIATCMALVEDAGRYRLLRIPSMLTCRPKVMNKQVVCPGLISHNNPYWP